MKHLDRILALVKEGLRNSEFREHCERNLGAAEKAGRYAQIIIGSGLCSDGAAKAVNCVGEEIFIHDITPAQVQRAALGTGQVFWHMATPAQDLPPAGEPTVTLHSLEIDNADGLAFGSPIPVRVSYDWNGGRPVKCSLRMDYSMVDGSSTTSWHYVEWLPGPRGRVECFFPPLNCQANAPRPQRGLLTAFVRLCATPNTKQIANRLPISNVCSTVIAIAPQDAEPDCGRKPSGGVSGL